MARPAVSAPIFHGETPNNTPRIESTLFHSGWWSAQRHRKHLLRRDRWQCEVWIVFCTDGIRVEQRARIMYSESEQCSKSDTELTTQPTCVCATRVAYAYEKSQEETRREQKKNNRSGQNRWTHGVADGEDGEYGAGLDQKVRTSNMWRKRRWQRTVCGKRWEWRHQR